MKILRKILAELLLLILLVISLAGVLTQFPAIFGVQPDWLHRKGQELASLWNAGASPFWFWLGLFVSSLATLLFGLLSLIHRPAKVEVQMADGNVVILDSAIRKYIMTALSDMPDITPQRIDLRQTRKGLQADIYSRVRTSESPPELQRVVISKVRSALSDDLGITAVGDIQVYIKDFAVTPRPAPSPPEPSLSEVRSAEPVTAATEISPVGLPVETAPEPRPLGIKLGRPSEGGTAESESSGVMSERAGDAGETAQRKGFFSRWKKDPASAEPQLTATSSDESATAGVIPQPVRAPDEGTPQN
jgi:hypothetical protein